MSCSCALAAPNPNDEMIMRYGENNLIARVLLHLTSWLRGGCDGPAMTRYKCNHVVFDWKCVTVLLVLANAVLSEAVFRRITAFDFFISWRLCSCASEIGVFLLFWRLQDELANMTPGVCNLHPFLLSRVLSMSLYVHIFYCPSYLHDDRTMSPQWSYLQIVLIILWHYLKDNIPSLFLRRLDSVLYSGLLLTNHYKAFDVCSCSFSFISTLQWPSIQRLLL